MLRWIYAPMNPPFSFNSKTTKHFMTLSKKSKLVVVLLFGGQSAEHDVSLKSALNIFSALDKNKYDPVLVYIRSDGRWFQCTPQILIEGKTEILRKETLREVVLLPGNGGRWIFSDNGMTCFTADIVFPVLHGPYGEDGTIQGLLELAGVPYVGAGVLGSAVGMDKDIMKRLLMQAGLPVGKFLVFRQHEISQIHFKNIQEMLGLPVFVKPANLGSSVGVSKVETEKELRRAVDTAFQYDMKILIEASLQGREVECAVLGGRNPRVSGVGEVILIDHSFYSYEAKYIDADGAKLIISADLSQDIVEEVRRLALKTFQVLECFGLGRVDFFVTRNGVFVNEINTLPGFTSISMYPKLWEAYGISYAELLDEIIELGIENFQAKKTLKEVVYKK